MEEKGVLLVISYVQEGPERDTVCLHILVYPYSKNNKNN